MSIYTWLVGVIAVTIAIIAAFAEIRRARNERERSSRLAYEARDEFVDACAAAIEVARVSIDHCKTLAESKPVGSAFAFLSEQLTR